MIPHRCFYQLVLIALVWLFITLYLIWPRHRRAKGLQALTSAMPSRKHSRELKPFAGLTYKPHCALCEQEPMHPTPRPPMPPDPVPSTNRRPREIDTSMHFCPHGGCRYRGWLGLGNLRANGHPNGGLWRQFPCTACDSYFLETHGTLLHSKRIAVDLMVRVLACLAEGLGLRATARVFEVAPNTGRQWWGEAAEQLTAFTRDFLGNGHVNQLQLDELYAVLRHVKEGELREDDAIKRLERSPSWVWTAMDPESQPLLAIEVGTRTLAMAQRVVHQVIQVLAPACVPWCLTEGYRD
jgi:hypothetical protein